MKHTIGEHYRHIATPNYGWAKIIEILPANTTLNTNRFKVAKCEWTVDKNDMVGMIKYFRLSHLIKCDGK